MASLRTVACKKVFAELRPSSPSVERCWEFFLRILEIPRMSGHLTAIHEELQSISQRYEWNFQKDEVGNVLISAPASPGLEHVPSICFQSHADMVCVADEGLTHDFLKDPIVPQLITQLNSKTSEMESWLKATGTTLGSDDGVGVAISLAILADSMVKHGPLEMLVTADEETTMGGVNGLKEGWLKSPLLINIDSEREKAICIGCAGGFDNEMFVKVRRETPTWPSFKRINVKLSGLVGGHTGIDIHLCKSSAIQTMGRLLQNALIRAEETEAKESVFRLVTLTGGSAPNAIPKSTTVSLAVSDSSQLKQILEQEFQVIQTEVACREPTMQLQVEEEADSTCSVIPMDEHTSRKVIHFMVVAPFWVVRMSHSVANLVETSYATTVVSTVSSKHDAAEDMVVFKGMGRSSVNSHLHATYRSMKALCEGFGIECGPKEDFFPGWAPNPDSSLLQIAKKAHLEALGSEPEIYAIHAGLECGLIADKYPGMQCVSVGPEIHGAHSPEEKLLVGSFERCYNLVRKTVELVAAQNSPK